MRQLQSVYCWKPFQLSAFKCAVLFFRDKLLLDTFQCNSNNCEFIDGISLQIHLPNSFFSHLFVPVVCICDVPFCVHTARIKTYTEKRIVIRRLTLHEISQSLILFAPWNRLNLEFHYFVLLQILLEFPEFILNILIYETVGGYYTIDVSLDLPSIKEIKRLSPRFLWLN